MLGCGQRENKDRERWAAPRERERGFSPFFSSFSFSDFLSLLKINFQICFEFCLNSNFAEKILNTHGLVE
jgi:hypothetical protein